MTLRLVGHWHECVAEVGEDTARDGERQRMPSGGPDGIRDRGGQRPVAAMYRAAFPLGFTSTTGMWQ